MYPLHSCDYYFTLLNLSLKLQQKLSGNFFIRLIICELDKYKKTFEIATFHLNIQFQLKYFFDIYERCYSTKNL